MPVSVTDLHYVALAVPDLAAEREFFGKQWGLIEVAEQDGKVYFAAEGMPHPYVLVLREDAERKTDLVGFSAASKDDVLAIFEQVKAAGANWRLCLPLLRSRWAGDGSDLRHHAPRVPHAGQG
jgi:catechol 2,3-dioxygenase-like lactoylglutathione lyase family enzyme